MFGVALIVACQGAVPEARPADVTMKLGPRATCDDPGAREDAWFDVDPIAMAPSDSWDISAGAPVLADFDNDGHVDLFSGGTEPGLRWGDGSGAFHPDPGATAGLDLSGVAGGAAADVDGDGDLDLFVARGGRGDLLLRNEGGWFSDATSADLAALTGATLTAAWGDVDGDHDLDLVTGGWGDSHDALDAHGGGVHLFLNEGGELVDAKAWMPAEVLGAWVFGVALHDVDGDGLPDLFSVGDRADLQPSVLLMNRGDRFEVAGSSGFHAGFNGMGVGLGDVDGDGGLDVFESSMMAVSLLLARDVPDGVVYVDHTAGMGLAPDVGARNQIVGWGAQLVDLDLDRDLDVASAFGGWDAYDVPEDQDDGLFLQGPDGFVAAEGFSSRGAGRGLQTADIDNNGWPDLVLAELDGDWSSWRGRCSTNGWITVRLEDELGTPQGVGAEVRVTVDGEVQTGWIRAGGTGMFGSSPAEVQFGLGTRHTVDALEVRWPDGSQWQTTELIGDRVVTVVRQREER